jgi:tetratricopeptide (TPR) repeat protein
MNDKDINNLIQRAEALMKTNWLHAIQLLQQAADENPEDPRPLVALGDFFQRRQLYTRAISSYQTALKLLPEDFHLKYIIGNCYFANAEYRLAIVYYDQIENPGPDIRYNKALALAYLGRHRESITIMVELLDVIDNNHFIYFLLIEQLLRVEDWDRAKRYMAQAEAKVGNHRHLLLLKAVINYHLEVWLPAYHAFSVYEQTSPLTQADHFAAYATCAHRIGMPEQAVSILERGIRENPYNLRLYEDLVRHLIQLGRNSQAEDALARARSYFPQLNPILRLLQARLKNQEH